VVVNYKIFFGKAVSRFLACCARGRLPPSAPPLFYATVSHASGSYSERFFSRKSGRRKPRRNLLTQVELANGH